MRAGRAHAHADADPADVCCLSCMRAGHADADPNACGACACVRGMRMRTPHACGACGCGSGRRVLLKLLTYTYAADVC